jgi:hypothetical protein
VQLQQLRPAHATELVPPSAAGRIAGTSTAVIGVHAAAIRQLQFDLKLEFQVVPVQILLPSHLLFPFIGKSRGPASAE